jgi:hypothetical protein
VVESKIVSVKKIKSRIELYKLGECELCLFHDIIHQMNLCAMSIKFTHVTGTSKVATCIKFHKIKCS